MPDTLDSKRQGENMKDFFRPHTDPARLIYDVFQAEAAKRPERNVDYWLRVEREVVWKTARDYAQQRGLRVPTMEEVERAESNATGSVDYGAKWAYGVAELLR